MVLLLIESCPLNAPTVLATDVMLIVQALPGAMPPLQLFTVVKLPFTLISTGPVAVPTLRMRIERVFPWPIRAGGNDKNRCEYRSTGEVPDSIALAFVMVNVAGVAVALESIVTVPLAAVFVDRRYNTQSPPGGSNIPQSPPTSKSALALMLLNVSGDELTLRTVTCGATRGETLKLGPAPGAIAIRYGVLM